MIPAIIGIIILALGGGTIAISDNAKPGDVLFGIDRSVENIRLNLSSEEDKDKLKIKFAEERIKEVEDILKEDEQEDDSTDDTDDTDETDDSDEDLNEDTAKKENVEAGISFALDLLSGANESEELNALISRLNSFMDEIPEGTELDLKISDEGANFLRVRSDDDSNKFDFEIKETGGEKVIIKTRDAENKLKVEIRGDEVRIESRVNNSGSGSLDDDSDDEDEIEDEVEDELEDESEDDNDEDEREDEDDDDDDDDDDESDDDESDDDESDDDDDEEDSDN